MARLERKHQAMLDAHAAGRRTDYFRINQEIHQLIIDGAANPVLSSIYAMLMSKVHRARGAANADTLRRTFKKYVGITPADYRRQHQETAE